jgi:predicted dithiol-disulfide oxidoreductase (DUF899 family)
MESHRVVSRDQWIEERKGLLAKEKNSRGCGIS